MAELKLQQSRLDGRYDVLECLGRGSYAEIYVAKDNAAADDAPATVVIKALNIFLQETPDAELEHTLVSNFQNEAVALDLVRHPHIISRLGHGTAIDLGGTTFHYIVLEYMPGGDMAALSRHHPLSIEKAVGYLEQVCSGLAHAHKCGVIHRDIKPQNLLLTSDRKTVKIADFGVARFEATEGAITRVGTNIYAAPEHNPLVQTGPLDAGALPKTRTTDRCCGHLFPRQDDLQFACGRSAAPLCPSADHRIAGGDRGTLLVRSLCYAFWREPRRRGPKAVTRQSLSFGMNWLMPYCRRRSR